MKLLKISRRRGATPSELVLRIDVDREVDGRWIVEAVDLPGVMSYGKSKDEAVANAAMLALHVIDERMGKAEELPDFDVESFLYREHAHSM